MHFLRASVISTSTLLAIAHPIPLNPQPFPGRDVYGDGDIISDRVPSEYPQFPAALLPSVTPNKRAHVVKQDPQIITLPSPDPAPELLRPRSLGGCARGLPGHDEDEDVHIKGTKQGQVEGADVHIKGTKQGQVDEDVNRSPDGSKEQADVASGKRIH